MNFVSWPVQGQRGPRNQFETAVRQSTTLVIEAGFIYGEAALAAPSLTGNPLAIAGELLLISLSLFLINFEFAYWAYAYRVMGARPGEKAQLNMTLFDWGLSK